MSDLNERVEMSEPVKPAKSRSAAGCLLALCVGLSVLVLAMGASFYFFVSKPMADQGGRAVDRLADALSGVFGKTVEVKGSTAVLEKSEIEELAVVQRKIQVITKYETTWMGSKNTMIFRGDFLVKAGFDLSDGGQWTLVDGKISGEFPRAKVLSVEQMGDVELYYSENGLINRLSPADHASAVNRLVWQAKKDARRSDITAEAEKILRQRINDRLGAPLHGEGELFLP